MELNSRYKVISFLMGLSYMPVHQMMLEEIQAKEELSQMFPIRFRSELENLLVLRNDSTKEAINFSLRHLVYTNAADNISIEDFSNRCKTVLDLFTTKLTTEVLKVIRLGIVGQFDYLVSNNDPVEYIRQRFLNDRLLEQGLDNTGVYLLYRQSVEGEPINTNIYISPIAEQTIRVKLDVNNADMTKIIDDQKKELDKRITFFLDYANKVLLKLIGR